MKRYIHTADAVFAVILFCVFAVSLLMVLMTGAHAYQDIRDLVARRNSENVCVSYITTKLRHFDHAGGGVVLGDISGSPALLLSQGIGGTTYTTWIYYYDGSVRELYAEADYDAHPEDGLEIIDAGGLLFEVPAPGVIRVVCQGSGGSSAEALVSLRNEGAMG